MRFEGYLQSVSGAATPSPPPPSPDENLPNSTEKNGFVTATKLGTTDEIFVAATKNFAAATKRFVDKTKHFVVATKCFRYPYFNKCIC